MLSDNDSHEINFAQACEDHNKLPTDDVLLNVKEKVEKHIPALELLLKRFGVENLFAVYVLHRHFKVPDGFNLVGRAAVLDGRDCYWIRRVANDTLNSGEVCAQKFILDEQKCWVPCEFRKSSAPDPRKANPQFLLEISSYLKEHDLTLTFGLERIVPELRFSDTLELRVPNGELLLVRLVPTEVESLRVNYPTATTTSYRWSDQGFARKNFCVPDPDERHPPPKNGDFSLQESQISIYSLIEEQYPRIRDEMADKCS